MKTILLLLFVSLSAWAEDLYFTQQGAGARDGSSVANAWSVTNASTAGNWGAGAGKISAGDVLHVSGTVTNQLTIQGSGSAGSPITILFESGAKFSKERWGTTGSDVPPTSAAIYDDGGHSYLTIDGSNSVNSFCISATDTGTALTYDDYNAGVLWHASAGNIIIQNLTVTNMYIRTPHSLTDVKQNGSPIAFRSGTYNNILITNCAVWQANIGIYFGLSSGANTNIHIINSKGGDCGEGVFVTGAEAVATQAKDVLIRGCTFQDEYTWSGVANTHCNLIHAHSTANGSSGLTDLIVENSTFQGTGSDHMTSFIFFEGYLTNLIIRNNLILPTDTTFGGNGLITIKGSPNCRIENNTILGFGGVGIGIGTTTYGAGQDFGIRITNNFIRGCGTACIYDPSAMTLACDYNNYGAGQLFNYAGGDAQWGDWKTETGYDVNSNTNTASIDGNYVPTSGDTALKDKGFTITSFSNDKLGTTRPQGSAWDIGAFEYTSGAAPPAANTPRTARIRGIRLAQ